MRTRLILTFLSAVALAVGLAVLSAGLLVKLASTVAGGEFMETLSLQPRVREQARAVSAALAAGKDAVAQVAPMADLEEGARTLVVAMDGTVWADSAGAAGRAAAVPEVMGWLSLQNDDPPAMVLKEPILGGDGRLWGYYVYTQALPAPTPVRLDTGSPVSQAAAGVMVGGQVLALVVSLVLFWALGRHVVQPVVRLSAVVGRIADGDLGARAGIAGRTDELGQLARDVDRMAGSLQVAREKAAAADESRRFMLAAISHDLRTPLTGLLAHAEALKSGIADDAGQSLTIIQEKGLLIKQLLDDLFELAALDADRSPWPATRQDVAEMVRLAVAAMLPDLDQAGFAVEAEIPETPVWAELPRGKLERVLDNLLVNARKYGANGRWLGVRVEAAGGTVRIAVSDRGPGIPPGEQEAVFDRYYRSSGAASGRAQGAGLGLAVAREIVQRLGGRMGIDSPPEGGATFWAELPLHAQP